MPYLLYTIVAVEFIVLLAIIGFGLFNLIRGGIEWRRQQKLEKQGSRATANVEQVSGKYRRKQITLTWQDNGQRRQSAVTLYGRATVAKTEKICYDDNRVVLVGRKPYLRFLPTVIGALFLSIIILLTFIIET